MVRRNVEEVKIGKWRGNQRGFPAFSGYLANNRTLGMKRMLRHAAEKGYERALQGRGALSKRGKAMTGQRGVQGKDPINSARAAWNQSKRKDRPMPKAEQDRREQAYRALLKGKK